MVVNGEILMRRMASASVGGGGGEREGGKSSGNCAQSGGGERGAPTAHLSHLTCCRRCILTCAHSSPSPQDGGGGGDRLTWAGADLERLSALAAASALLARCWPSSPEEPE